MKYRSDIDGLRAVAVLLVLLFHVGAPGVSGGFIGVDVFFVISGFLITSIVKSEIDAGAFSVAHFYERRIRRIFPALIAVYLFCTLISALIFVPSDLASFGKSLAASASFASNIFFYFDAGYFAAPSHDKPLLHTWSLSVEEQFYLLWPPMLLLASRYLSVRILLLLMAIAVTGSLAGAEFLVTRVREFTFFMLPTRAWELGLGGLLALFPVDLRLRPALSHALSMIGLGLILYSAVTLHGRSDFPGVSAFPACLGTIMLLVSGGNQRGFVNALLSFRPIVFLGLISYSLYLWHWPLIVFVRYFLDRKLELIECVIIVALSFAAAILSYRYVEAPFRRPIPDRSHSRVTLHWRRKSVLIRGVAATAACALIGISMAVEGWSWRLPERAVAVDYLSNLRSSFRDSCHGVDKTYSDPPECTLGAANRGGGYDIVVVGDSHADHFVAGFDALLRRQGLTGRQLTTGSCPPLFGVHTVTGRGRKRCEDFGKAIDAFLERHGEVKLVVLAARWALYSETTWLPAESEERRFLVDSKSELLTLANSRRVLTEGLDRTVDKLVNRGVRVLLMAQMPPLSTRRNRCMIWSRWFGKDESRCYEPAASAIKRISYSKALIASIAQSNEKVDAFYPDEILCDTETCIPVLDGFYLYFDEDHLNGAGSVLVTRHLNLLFDK
jgi:peptidoglycan/LPS O-acetylase OafA/YrhL